jgi:hypothetical protein
MAVGAVDLQPLLDGTDCCPPRRRGIRQGHAVDVEPRGCTNKVGA